MRQKVIIVLLMGFFSNFFGFGQNNHLVELTSEMEKDPYWKDLVLSIIKKKKLSTGFWELHCKAIYKNDTVGFKVRIKDDIPPGVINGKINRAGFVPNGLEIHYSGKESDRFIKALSELYGITPASRFTREGRIFTIFSLNENRVLLEKTPARFKVFFNDPQLYAEFYINIDLKNNILEFNEKDTGFRQNIIEILSEK